MNDWEKNAKRKASEMTKLEEFAKSAMQAFITAGFGANQETARESIAAAECLLWQFEQNEKNKEK